MKEKEEFNFKVKTTENKFYAEVWDSKNEINIIFKHFNNKATICEIHDSEAYKLYAHFLDTKIFSEKRFEVEIINSCILFKEKSVCLPEDTYNRKLGENISLEKALNKRHMFYMSLMDLIRKRLQNIEEETEDVIRKKWKNICDKKIENDKQLEFNFEK